MNKKLELQLRAEFEQYQAKAHLEDRMSFIDYVGELNGEVFKDHKIVLSRDRYGDPEIMFYPVN